ncbi:MAG TPA: tagatose 1,6-diphosphate aldolase [Phycisphaerae bacterium]|nr:tagatose 1,6-diphosphate aldolase [Phycisphaerae bacterium]HOB76060.1 tagatose 1,6-diphosphate aldolase [Phycisphaerae bacterium]HOJ55478.1 tagatose 1,6-diphosphate aldolase [Phycisphaerae bacterium]HOL25707.1 tagatose 1,6-diphosphate aldolase [Phycisphaerae bacterium]HPP19600.1 tagatose 1,6-diphosphate aldolase [Phycisphaerae bacterium]
MMKATISRKKLERLERLADQRGVIAAAAMDQRGSLKKSIAKEKGIDPAQLPSEVLAEFKEAVSRILTPYASAILLDTEYGQRAIRARAANAGLLLAYEKTGYDASQGGRLGDLLDHESVRRLMHAGADAIKILLYYAADDDPKINDIKHAWIERIGAECAAEEMPFFLEVIAYDARGGDEKGIEFARRKPELVMGYMREFSKAHYRVDVLKVEIPFNIAYVEGSKANQTGQVAYDRAQAKDIVRQAAECTRLPFIYLSAGVDDDVFRESLELAGEAGVSFAGVLCGRATWKGGIPVYAKQGLKALEDWLSDRGVKNIEMLNEVLRRVAKPWWDKYGGRDQINVIERTN